MRVAAAGSRLPFAWQAQHTEPPGRVAARVAAAAGPPLGGGCLSCGRRSTQNFLEELRRAWPPLGRGCLSRGRRTRQSLQEDLRRAAGPRLPFVWQAQYTELPGGAAAWPPLGRGYLPRGRRSTHSLLEQLRRAWPPLGRGCLSCGRRSTQSFLEELRCAWPPLGRGCFRVAGAARTASWSNCGAPGRRWAAAAFHTTHRSSFYHITISHHISSQLIT